MQVSTGNRSAWSIAHKVDIAAVRVAMATLVKERQSQQNWKSLEELK